MYNQATVINAEQEGDGRLRLDIRYEGVTESLLFNFNGAALPAGLSVVAWVQWMES